jgi:hypothetical protein
VTAYSISLLCAVQASSCGYLLAKLTRTEAEVLAGRFKSVRARYYVLHDPEKLTDKYITAWMNFGIDVANISSI